MDHPPISQVVPIETDIEISSMSWADKVAYAEFSPGMDTARYTDEAEAREAVSTASSSGEPS